MFSTEDMDGWMGGWMDRKEKKRGKNFFIGFQKGKLTCIWTLWRGKMKNIWTALNQNDLLQIYIECWIMLFSQRLAWGLTSLQSMSVYNQIKPTWGFDFLYNLLWLSHISDKQWMHWKFTANTELKADVLWESQKKKKNLLICFGSAVLQAICLKSLAH